MAEGLKDESALFRHEIAFVMGQIQNSDTIDSLKEVLQDLNENPMVRHEAAEALGAIASPSTFSILEKYKNDIEPAVKESCEVALDIYNYFNTNEFQYADSLNEIKN
jgi:deoxyhypusine monooxygenase